MHPYCTVSYNNDKKLCTKVDYYADDEPKWNHEMLFKIVQNSDDIIKVNVWHHEDTSMH